MENLTQKQLIILSVAVAIIVSVAGTLGTIIFLSGGKPATIIERIIEKEAAPQAIINEKILRQEELVVAVVKRASPGVVSVVATKDVPVIERFFVDPFSDDPFFRQFEFKVPQFRQKGTERQETGAGSGFIVSADGLILTNKHVVADTKAEYTVFLNDGTKLPATVLARDPFQDLAILKITPPPAGLIPLTLGDSDTIQIGQTVVAIGNALGEFRNTVSVGIVSGLGRSIVAQSEAGAESLQELIQTDAAINPGNSGGPLFNIRGEVIGINVAIARGAENIGFSIPVNKAKRDIESVKTAGRIIYPLIGVRYITLNKEIQEKNKLPVDYGAWIAKGEDEPGIVKGSPAEKAAIKEGDIILKMNGERIDMDHPLGTRLLKYNVGETVTLTILRDGKEIEVTVTLEERK